MADDELLLGPVALQLDAGGGLVEVADEIEVQIEDLAVVMRHPVPFQALLPAHVRTRDAALGDGSIMMLHPPHTAENAVGIQRDVAHGVDALFLCLEEVVDRRAIGIMERRIEEEAVVHLRAEGDHGDRGGEALAALGLHVFQHRAPLESIQRLAHEHLHAVLAEVGRQPRRSLGIEHAAPEIRAAVHEHHMRLRHLAEQRRRLRGDEPAADDHDLVLDLHHLAQRLHVAQRAQVEDIAEIPARELRAARAAAGGDARLAEFHRLSIAQHREMPLEIDLRDERIQPHVDLVLRIPLRVLPEQLCERRDRLA